MCVLCMCVCMCVFLCVYVCVLCMVCVLCVLGVGVGGWVCTRMGMYLRIVDLVALLYNAGNT